MAITYDKDGAYIEVTDNGVSFRRLIKWEDCVVSVPAVGTEKVDMAYINSSDQLVLVLEDESEIIINNLADLTTHAALTATHGVAGTIADAALVTIEIDADILTHKNTASAHHAKYTDAEAVVAALPMIIALGG